MKKLLVICLFAFAVQLNAQEADTEFLTDTVEFLKLTGTGDAFNVAISQIGAMVPEANKAAFTEEAKGTLEGLYTKIAKIYIEEFTHDDIKGLLDFYRSDLGKKLAEKQMPLMQKAMALGQSWGMEVQAIAQKHQ